MKINTIIAVIFCQVFTYAQVGINTTDPQATLDINGNLIVRTVPTTPASGTYDFLVVNSGSNEVQRLNGNLGTSGNASFSSTFAKASRSSTTALLGANIYSGYNRINFLPASLTINPGNHFNATDDTYVVPSTGIYKVEFEFRYGNGVELQLLSFNGNPRMAILKQEASGYSIVDDRAFSAANVGLEAGPINLGALSLVLSQGQINSMYPFTAGDVLSFEVFLGGVALSVLGNARATVSIRKISD